MTDRKGLPSALQEAWPVDLAHYDSDKSAEGRNFACPLMWRFLRPGGILVSDDVSDNLGFRNFCGEFGLEPVIIRHRNKYQGLVIKPGGEPSEIVGHSRKRDFIRQD